jgi:hypothetical protein
LEATTAQRIIPQHFFQTNLNGNLVCGLPDDESISINARKGLLIHNGFSMGWHN